jgi:lipopolysaccharide/colanic/teichoic acid biosynthesis glycosyltransferase
MASSISAHDFRGVSGKRKKPRREREPKPRFQYEKPGPGDLLLRCGKHLDYYWQKAFISPFFLVGSLVVFLFVPDDVIKDRLWNGLRRSFNMLFKRGLDILVAILGIVVSAPFFLLIPIFIKLDSRGAVFYRQLRIGRNRRQGYDLGSLLIYQDNPMYFDRRKVGFHGQPFHLVKFRTMQHNAELMTGPVWAASNDPRVTRVGRILRATHLDELPQFLNVLKGEMSIVGPRPERPCFVTEFADAISGYTTRFKVKPGITGAAQIYNGYDTCLEDVKDKLGYELEYIDKGTFWFDLKLIFLTILSMIKGEGDRKI